MVLFIGLRFDFRCIQFSDEGMELLKWRSLKTFMVNLYRRTPPCPNTQNQSIYDILVDAVVFAASRRPPTVGVRATPAGGSRL